jgi:hypothetical protein
MAKQSNAVKLTAQEIKLLSDQIKREHKVGLRLLEERAAHVRARMEEAFASKFRADHDKWVAAVARIEQDVAETNKKIVADVQEMGLPAEFAPYLELNWYSRGENASKARVAELRRVGEAKIAEMIKTGQAALETWVAEAHRKIIVGGLQSPGAQQLLESMPKAEALLPEIALAELEAQVPQRVRSPQYSSFYLSRHNSPFVTEED